MPKSANQEKLTGRLLVPLGPELEGQLRAVAKDNDTSPQDLLREAARAIVRFHSEHKAVPRPMEVRARDFAPVSDAEVARLLELVRERFRQGGSGVAERFELNDPAPGEEALKKAAADRLRKREQEAGGASPAAKPRGAHK